MMNLFSKKAQCTHHWHYIGKSTVYSNHGLDYDEVNALYCPKCEEETIVSDERWAQLQEIQKIREDYLKSVVEAAEAYDLPVDHVLERSRLGVLSAGADTPPSDVVTKPSLTKRPRKSVTAKA